MKVEKKKKSLEIHKTHWGNVLKMGKYQSPQNKEPKWKPVVPRSTVPTASRQEGYFQSLTVRSAWLLHVCARDSVLCSGLYLFRVGHMKTVILTCWHLGSCASPSHCGYSRKKSHSLHRWVCLFSNDFCEGRGGDVLSANPGVCIGQELLF